MNRHEYTWNELADIHLAYGAALGNSAEARRIYHQRYPNRTLPAREMFVNIDQRLRDSGSLSANMRETGRPRQVRTPQFDDAVLRKFEDSPSTSTRKVAHEMGVQHRLVWNVLNENNLHPYHKQKVQALSPDDYALRVDFCDWFLAQTAQNPAFPGLVLFTDEASFTREGMFNSHNQHVWEHVNPHATFIHRHQKRFTVNLWAGIIGDCLIGPYILSSRLDGHNYLIFLEEVMPELLEVVPLAALRTMWFQHDGAPAHFAAAPRNHITAEFGVRWIGRGGPVPWPPRSPDLSPLDFYLWGNIKSLVYETPVESEEDLVARIVEAAHRVRETPGIFQRVRDSMLRRCDLCRQLGGRHFEHTML